jgi:hypothetical protein
MSTPQFQQVHDNRRPSTIRIWAMRLSILIIGAALVAYGYAAYHDRTAPVGHLAAPRSNPAHSTDPAVPAVLDDGRTQAGSLPMPRHLMSPAPAQELTGDQSMAGCRWPCRPSVAISQLL